MYGNEPRCQDYVCVQKGCFNRVPHGNCLFSDRPNWFASAVSATLLQQHTAWMAGRSSIPAMPCSGRQEDSAVFLSAAVERQNGLDGGIEHPNEVASLVVERGRCCIIPCSRSFHFPALQQGRQHLWAFITLCTTHYAPVGGPSWCWYSTPARRAVVAVANAIAATIPFLSGNRCSQASQSYFTKQL